MKDQPLQMKLIFVLNHFAHNSSSHFYHIIHLLETLARKGVEIALIIEKCEDKPLLTVPAIRIFPINRPKLIRFLYLSYLLKKLHDQGFDRVFTRISWPAAIVSILVAFFTGQKTYYWQSTQGSHEYYHALPRGWKKFRQWLKSELPFRFIKKHITYFVTGPESMRRYYHLSLGVRWSKIIILYNDVDLQRFKPVDVSRKKLLRNKWNVSESATVFLFVHRFSPVRKTRFYFPYMTDEFFKWNPNGDCIFFFAGGGPEKSKLQSVLSGKPYADKVIFADDVPNAAIHELYQMSDIFIQPSQAEGFPRTLIEAMACGLPVVATAAGGVRDVMGRRQQTYIVEPDDLIGFLQRISGLYIDPPMLKVLAEENLLQVRKFGTEAIAEMYIERIFARK